MTAIALLGSSLLREGDRSYETAREIGRLLARRGAEVVCGGYGGVMEAGCRGAAESGGSSVGIVLAGRGEPNRWVSRAVRVPDLSERLRRLRDDADGWIFLPRGLGTLLELVWVCESIVKQEVPPRPLVLLGDFWRATAHTILAEATGPGAEALAASICFAESPAEAVERALGEKQVRSPKS